MEYRLATKGRDGSLRLSRDTYTMDQAVYRVKRGRKLGIKYIITDSIGDPIKRIGRSSRS